jgi:hypothetical protein
VHCLKTYNYVTMVTTICFGGKTRMLFLLKKCRLFIPRIFNCSFRDVWILLTLLLRYKTFFLAFLPRKFQYLWTQKKLFVESAIFFFWFVSLTWFNYITR